MKNSEAQQRLQVAEIQLQLRERYTQLKPSFDAVRYELYPATKRYLSGDERRALRRYWTDVVFGEYLAISKFGAGQLAELWGTTYSKWPVNALLEHAAFREEWCWMQKDKDERIYFGAYADEFINTINSLYAQANKGVPLDLDHEIRTRREGLPPGEGEGNVRFQETTALDLQDRLKRLADAHNETGLESKVYLAILKQAFEALKRGNYGVGACIVDAKSKTILYEGSNRVFQPIFRSDSHAEMNVINLFEAGLKAPEHKDAELVLYTTLEPCPMCFSRIIASKISKVYYLTADEQGGMVSRREQMPPVWTKLCDGKVIEKAPCAPEFSLLASDIFARSREKLDEKLQAN